MNDKEKMVREEIAKITVPFEDDYCTEVGNDGADQAFAIFKKHGGVYLSDNQELPKIPDRRTVYSVDGACRDTQQDMRDDGFRRVEGIG